MRVLQLCHKPSKPSIDGGCIAIDNISRGLLKNDVELKILTLSTHKHPFNKQNFDPDFVEKTGIDSVFADTKLNIVDAFSNLVTSDSYNVSRFFSTDFDLMLERLLKRKKFDIIHLESLFMTPYISTIARNSKAKVVLRSHNLEYMIWERLARQTNNPAKKIYLKVLSRQLKEYEMNVLKSVHGIAAITKSDLEKYEALGYDKPSMVVPFGIDIFQHNDVEKVQKVNKINLFHIGAMDWKPNLEGVCWFLEDIWPNVLSKVEDVNLHLAGRNMPDWLMNEDHLCVENHGEVDSAVHFMKSYDVMVVPLLSAGGMRVKIIEGMSLGKIVLSTSIGAEGINYTDREKHLNSRHC